MNKQKFEFTAIESLSLGNSFGTIKEQNDVQLNVTIGINDDRYGWFEIYDIESGGEEWYSEGGIWFRGKDVVDYDGVYSLPTSVISKLKELGYNYEG